MAARKRRSLVEALAETQTLRASRKLTSARNSRAKREAMAPAPPATALTAYTSAMSTYATRVRALVERHVLSRLPVLGSGDPLDRAALEEGLAALQPDLDALAVRASRSARAAGKRVAAHARREVSRMLQVEVPDDAITKFAVEEFTQRNVALLRRAGVAQIERIRKAIVEYEEGDSMRQDILDSLWVSRNRSVLIARDQCFKMAAETNQQWCLAAGSKEYVWATRRDELVRPGHARLDGKVFKWTDPPHTGGNEGHNHPGRAINCRCRAVPVEALLK